MQVEDKEINVPCVRLLGNLRIRKLNALLMIGAVVSVLAITVINLTNYIHLNVKAKLNASM